MLADFASMMKNPLKLIPMARLNCLSRKSPTDAADPPVPSRPVHAIPHYSRPEQIKLNVQASLVEINQLPVNPQPHRQHAPDGMKNVVRRGAGGGNVPAIDRNYIEISDDEDSGEDALGSVASRHQRPSVQRINNQRVSPPPAGNETEESQPDGIIAPSPPKHGYADVQAHAGFEAAFLIEDGDEFDVNDPFLAQIMEEGFSRERDEEAARPPQATNQSPPSQPIGLSPPPAVDARVLCVDQVLILFPGICREYVCELYDTGDAKSSDYLIAHILDKIDNGIAYPRAKDTQKSLKRKRETDEDEEAARKYGSADRVMPDGPASVRPFM